MISAERSAFDELVRRIDNAPWMTSRQGAQVWEHFRRTTPDVVLDIGTCYGTSAAYMAGALRAFGGTRVVTVDSAQFDDRSDAAQWCRALWDRCGVTDLIEMVRIPYSNYAWWLMEQVRGATTAGRCEPQFDFVYLDGAKLITLDGASVALIEPLLRPGGWLLLDDLDWTFAEHDGQVPVVRYGEDLEYTLSSAEMETPHLRSVFDCIVRLHPGFVEFTDDGVWGWARKRIPDDPGDAAPRRRGLWAR